MQNLQQQVPALKYHIQASDGGHLSVDAKVYQLQASTELAVFLLFFQMDKPWLML